MTTWHGRDGSSIRAPVSRHDNFSFIQRKTAEKNKMSHLCKYFLQALLTSQLRRISWKHFLKGVRASSSPQSQAQWWFVVEMSHLSVGGWYVASLDCLSDRRDIYYVGPAWWHLTIIPAWSWLCLILGLRLWHTLTLCFVPPSLWKVASEGLIFPVDNNDGQIRNGRMWD